MNDKLYPYFSTVQFKNVVKEANTRARQQNIYIPTLKFKGTIKLHGTNCSVYTEFSQMKLIKQSKNFVITQEKDNAHFALFVDNNSDSFMEIFKNIKEKFSSYQRAIVYGEWCGKRIQPLSSFVDMDYLYFIFAIKLMDAKNQEYWLTESEIKSCLNQEKLTQNRIYNIFNFKTYEVEVDMNYPQLIQNELVRITNEVEQCCPVTYSFGVAKVGEGVVWRCVNKGFTDLVFKVKGKEHSVTNVTTLAAVDTEKVNSTYEFIEKVVTENRLNQGLDYLREQHLDITRNNIPIFLKWIANDCLKEERDVIIESHLDEKDVMRTIAMKAKDWYSKKII